MTKTKRRARVAVGDVEVKPKYEIQSERVVAYNMSDGGKEEIVTEVRFRLHGTKGRWTKFLIHGEAPSHNDLPKVIDAYVAKKTAKT